MGKPLMLPPVVLASASPARLQLLRSAGIEPVVRVSYVDEELLTEVSGWKSATEVAGGLAIAKAQAVAQISDESDVIIIGCDSVMEFADGLHGKPQSSAHARERLVAMRGGSGYLHTGHCVIHRVNGINQVVQAVTNTHVVFHDMSDAEIAAYVATGEPLYVAGSFTLDSLGGPFIKEIHGDPSNVIGLSLPTLRHLFAELGIGWEHVLEQAPRVT
jgi:septum formation protein